MLVLHGNKSSMEITLLIKSFLGLVVILAILIFFLFYLSKKRKIVQIKSTQSVPSQTDKEDYSLSTLLKVIKDRTSTTKELKDALDTVIKYHGTIHPKLGLRPHPDFDTYGEILLRICRHPNTNKNIILDFDKALEAKNEEYKREINDFLTKGLNSLGA